MPSTTKKNISFDALLSRLTPKPLMDSLMLVVTGSSLLDDAEDDAEIGLSVETRASLSPLFDGTILLGAAPAFILFSWR
jgi:hypothetical protein